MGLFHRKNQAPRNAGIATPVNVNADKFLKQASTLIPAEVRMISGCEIEQTSADVANAANQLPNPAGRAGGACTSTLLKMLYRESDHAASSQQSFQNILVKLRENLKAEGYTQVPQLSSSRPLDLGETRFALASGSGRRRALLVGINYRGQNGELRGCHNDVLNMKRYLTTYHGFPEQDVLVLMDDGIHKHPTRQNILRALQALVKASVAGESVFFHYSGHGGLLAPQNNLFKTKQKDFDQTLIPLDHVRTGQIRDFSLFTHFVQPMAAGVTVTCLLDCCHSGSVLDLPYSFRATNIGERSGAMGGMVMAPQMDFLSNLAFLYLLSGARLPSGFEEVTDHFEDVTGEDMEQYEGVMAEDATNDIDGGDIGYDGYDNSDMDGQAMDGQAMDGQVMDGQVMDGQVMDGQAMEDYGDYDDTQNADAFANVYDADQNAAMSGWGTAEGVPQDGDIYGTADAAREQDFSAYEDTGNGWGDDTGADDADDNCNFFSILSDILGSLAGGDE